RYLISDDVLVLEIRHVVLVQANTVTDPADDARETDGQDIDDRPIERLLVSVCLRHWIVDTIGQALFHSAASNLYRISGLPEILVVVLRMAERTRWIEGIFRDDVRRAVGRIALQHSVCGTRIEFPFSDRRQDALIR